MGIPSRVVKFASYALQAEGRVESRTLRANDAKQTRVSFIYSPDHPKDTIDQIIEEKTLLLEQHYNLSDIIGQHGEQLVATACSNLGYTEIEIRKEKHGNEDLGIAKHDIDVFCKHPSGKYYQYIEVKNRRYPLGEPDVNSVLQTTRRATARWKLDLRPAVVTRFTTETAGQLAQRFDLPIALSPGEFVPTSHRVLYETLNSRLDLDIAIADTPPTLLTPRIRQYTTDYKYRQSEQSPTS